MPSPPAALPCHVPFPPPPTVSSVCLDDAPLPQPNPAPLDSAELWQTSKLTPLLAFSLAPPQPLLDGMATSPRNPPPLFVLPLSPPPRPPDTALASPPLPKFPLSLSRSPPFLLPSAVSLTFLSKPLDDAFTLPRIIPSRNIISPSPPPQPPDPMPVDSAELQPLLHNSNDIAPCKALCTKTRISKLLQQDSRHRRCHRRARRPRQRPLMPRNPYHARSRTSIPVTRLVDRSDLARVFADEDVEGAVEDLEEV
ncbi:hypothetical protein EI94DRAFT_1761887 [Lactarius quietus]|nr:hypothetical protein EI94DRAFT_1761887 [Lactarius quietus]